MRRVFVRKLHGNFLRLNSNLVSAQIGKLEGISVVYKKETMDLSVDELIEGYEKALARDAFIYSERWGKEAYFLVGFRWVPQFEQRSLLELQNKNT